MENLCFAKECHGKCGGVYVELELVQPDLEAVARILQEEIKALPPGTAIAIKLDEKGEPKP